MLINNAYITKLGFFRADKAACNGFIFLSQERISAHRSKMSKYFS